MGLTSISRNALEESANSIAFDLSESHFEAGAFGPGETQKSGLGGGLGATAKSRDHHKASVARQPIRE